MKTKFYMINHDNELTVAKTIILVFEKVLFSVLPYSAIWSYSGMLTLNIPTIFSDFICFFSNSVLLYYEVCCSETDFPIYVDQFFFKRRCRYATIKTIFILCLLPGPINFD